MDPTKTINLGQTREPAPFQFRVCVRHPEVERMIGIESAGADLRLKEWEYQLSVVPSHTDPSIAAFV